MVPLLLEIFASLIPSLDTEVNNFHTFQILWSVFTIPILPTVPVQLYSIDPSLELHFAIWNNQLEFLSSGCVHEIFSWVL